MDTAGTDQILQTLETLCRLEAAMAAYYLACSEQWNAQSSLWMDLAMEEERHEKVLRDLSGLVKAHPDKFQAGMRIEPTAIESFVGNITEMTTDIMKGQASLHTALSFGLGIEESIIEGRFFEVIISSNQKYLKFMEAMARDLAHHRQRIIEEMERVRESVSP